MLWNVKQHMTHTNEPTYERMRGNVLKCDAVCCSVFHQETYKRMHEDALYLLWHIMPHMNESCHIQMSRVAYDWVMSRVDESCHIGTSHGTYEGVMSRVNESCHIWMSQVTYKWAEQTYERMRRNILKRDAACCSVLQCAAVCCMPHMTNALTYERMRGSRS